MSSTARLPTTRAVLFLRDADVPFERHLVSSEGGGGSARRAEALGVEAHAVVDARVLQDDRMSPFLVLVPGDRKVSMKRMAAELGIDRVFSCHPKVAERATGYPVASMCPLGTKQPLPVYADLRLFELDRVFVDGGSPGFFIELDPGVLDDLLSPTWVEVAEER